MYICLSINDFFLPPDVKDFKSNVEIFTRVKMLTKQMQTNALIRIYSAGSYLFKPKPAI